MELIFLVTIGALVSSGFYLMLRPRTLSVILGLMMISHAANLTILLMSRLKTDRPPILGLQLSEYSDPLSQAFILTAIVIGFSMFALLLVVALRAGQERDSDLIDE